METINHSITVAKKIVRKIRLLTVVLDGSQDY